MKTQELVHANNQLGNRVMVSLYDAHPDKNILISPVSIAMVLQMALTGARGDTATAMAQTLGMWLEKLPESNIAAGRLIGSLQSRGGLQMANALFKQTGTGYPFNQDFVDNLQNAFQAEVDALDFAHDPQGSVDRINAWVQEHTKGCIPSIIDECPARTALMLLNATYFRGRWQTPFERGLTTDRAFALTDGSSVAVPTMVMEDEKMPYLETEDFQSVRLPYEGRKASMYIVLPREGLNLTDALSQVLSQSDPWYVDYQSRKGTLRLPKTKIEYSTSLADVLRHLGMCNAFDEGKADFSGMLQEGATEERLHISDVQHRTVLDINEEETEAAAVTAAMMSWCLSVGGGDDPFVMDCNRPYIIAIRDVSTSALLFLGLIVDPR